MSTKTVLNDIIPVVKQKGNILYDIFAMKVVFSSLCFAFRVFLFNILLVLKSVTFTWCEEWVITVQTIL